jgi:rhodanese-related sulfurtransferase
VGFIMSGLCPGTAVVSMVSGRIDAWVAFLGIVLGIALFALTVDWLPGLGALYAAGSGEVSLLHEVLGVPALALVVGIVAVATLAFVGAEVVEGIVQGKRPPVELTPPSRPRLKLAVGGSLAVVALLALAVSGPRPEMPPVQAASLAPLALAQSIIEREPGILVLDLRANPEGEKGIPGAALASGEGEAVEILGTTPPGTVVVVYDESGSLKEVPRSWPGTLDYRFLEGGLEGWRKEVLTPVALWGNTLVERDWVRKQNQIAAFFSGAAVQAAPVAAPPPAMSSGGAAPQRRAGGC